MRSGLTFPDVKASALAALAALGVSAATANAQLYSQNFEPPVATSSSSSVFGGYGAINNISGTSWQVQGGGGGAGVGTVSAGVDTNGVGGSQALFAIWDHSTATDYTYNQYTIYGIPGPGAGTPASLFKVSMDLFMDGSESSNTPIGVLIQNNGTDMSYTPTLANGAFTHVEFTLDQASNAGLFDGSMSFNIRLQHGAGGFGFDAGNVVRVDNILVEAIPEPTLGLLSLGGLAALRRRR